MTRTKVFNAGFGMGSAGAVARLSDRQERLAAGRATEVWQIAIFGDKSRLPKARPADIFPLQFNHQIIYG